MARIYVSHSARDRDVAQSLVAFLEGLGWSVWWDKSSQSGYAPSDVRAGELANAGASRQSRRHTFSAMPLLRVMQTSSWWSHTVMSRQSKFRYVIETSHRWMHSTTCRFRWPYRPSCGGVGGAGRELKNESSAGYARRCVRHGSRDLAFVGSCS